MSDTSRILSALSAMRVDAQIEEYEIHALIERTLSDAGISCQHEFRLSPGRRIDFMCGSVGIEVKKGRPQSAALRRQLEKYMADDRIDELIVVLQKPCFLPVLILGKPVHVLCLNRLWGVALS